jgi:hypothetical protein
MALTRADLNRIKTEKAAQRFELDVPPWNGTVLLRVMSGAERDAYEASITGSTAPSRGRDAGPRKLNLSNIRARLVAMCLIGEDGENLFDWRSASDVRELGELDANGLNLVFQECQKINGLTDEDVKELTKNLPADANGASGSD